MALAYSRTDTHFAFGDALGFLDRGVVGIGIYLDNVLACSGRGLDGCHSADADVGTGGIDIGYLCIRCVGCRQVLSLLLSSSSVASKVRKPRRHRSQAVSWPRLHHRILARPSHRTSLGCLRRPPSSSWCLLRRWLDLLPRPIGLAALLSASFAFSLCHRARLCLGRTVRHDWLYTYLLYSSRGPALPAKLELR